jgi:hypothetical protein
MGPYQVPTERKFFKEYGAKLILVCLGCKLCALAEGIVRDAETGTILASYQKRFLRI